MEGVTDPCPKERAMSTSRLVVLSLLTAWGLASGQPEVTALPGAVTGPTTEDKPASIIGTWNNEVRHAVHWSLYQPVHGARLRSSVVHFKQEGGRLMGYSLTPEHEQERWNKEGRTNFRSVKFAKGQLVFEFDIDELNHGWGHRTRSKAWVRVEAELKGDRLVGKWGIIEKQSGKELFSGEWDAVRSSK
jgi:hypothetical protein